MRFCNNCKLPSNYKLATLKLEMAKFLIVKQVQREAFESELQQLREAGIVGAKSKLSSLNPFLDEKTII